MSVQYRVIVAKKDERVEGDGSADVVIAVPLAVAALPEFDATVEYMRGRLKATGPTGQLLELLKSGEATAALARIAATA